MIKRFSSPFKKMDALLFKKVDQLQEGPGFKHFINQLEALSDEQRKWIHQILSTSFVLFPLLLLLISWRYYNGLQGEWEILGQIHHKLQEINQKTGQVHLIGRSLMGQRVLNNKSDFEAVLGTLIQEKKLNPSKVSVTHFKQEDIQGNVQKSAAKVTFDKFSSKEFADLLHGMVVIHKMKMKSLETSLSPQSSLLKGTLELLYFSKRTAGENQTN